MHRRRYLPLLLLSLSVMTGCARPRRPATTASPSEWSRSRSSGDGRGGNSLGGPIAPTGRRDCGAAITADECARIDSAITVLQNHPDARCRAAGDSARAGQYRGQLGFVQSALSGMGSRRRLDAPQSMTQPGMAWIGADQFDWRGFFTEVIARAVTPDSLKPDSVAAKCRR